METTAQYPSYPSQQMKALDKKSLALTMLKRQQPVIHLAQQNNVSRKFLYTQQKKATQAVDEAFTDEPSEDEKVMFYLPVTKSWLKQFVLVFVFDGHGSFRGVTKAMQSLLDYSLSVGTIANIVQSVIPKAKEINEQQDLSAVRLATLDELFHNNHPVLTGVDISSLYCYLLAHEPHRDRDTWAIHLWDLQTQGLVPQRTIADDGDG